MVESAPVMLKENMPKKEAEVRDWVKYVIFRL